MLSLNKATRFYQRIVESHEYYGMKIAALINFLNGKDSQVLEHFIMGMKEGSSIYLTGFSLGWP